MDKCYSCDSLLTEDNWTEKGYAAVWGGSDVVLLCDLCHGSQEDTSHHP